MVVPSSYPTLFILEKLIVPSGHHDNESLFPLLSSPTSLRDLAEVIRFKPYVLVNLHMFNSVPLKKKYRCLSKRRIRDVMDTFSAIHHPYSE